ncbi:MAG: alpha/beta hydrolase-fold protein [Phycisphaerae bacterium]
MPGPCPSQTQSVRRSRRRTTPTRLFACALCTSIASLHRPSARAEPRATASAAQPRAANPPKLSPDQPPSPALPKTAELLFRVALTADLSKEPVAGRLVVYLVRGGSPWNARIDPAGGPFFFDPQPMFGVDVDGLTPGGTAIVDDRATAFPDKLSKLPPGAYRARAVLDRHRLNSRWRREPGNLFSDVVSFTVADPPQPQVIEFRLAHMVAQKAATKPSDGSKLVETFEIRSRLLSDFRKTPVMLRAGVVFPQDHDPDRAYAAVYHVPGFGGDHTGAYRTAMRLANEEKGSARGVLARSSFTIVLDPEGPNGHHLFADSANNGPVATALVTELIPALEARFKLIREPSARLLRGHSSGGWSTLWLALHYPDVFGACWSSAPDPVDFRRMQKSDIYSQTNFYTEPATGTELGSFRTGADVRMTVREENLMEEVLGPDNTSAQQWDSWFAAFGPRNAAGHPAALFDPVTGRIDAAVAAAYRAYDIGLLVKDNPSRYLPIFRRRVRLIVGDQDSFYLNEAVALLKETLDAIPHPSNTDPDHGYIRIIAGAGHGSVLRSDQARAIPSEMLDHLRRAGHLSTD